jgi:hypothetical protein
MDGKSTISEFFSGKGEKFQQQVENDEMGEIIKKEAKMDENQENQQFLDVFQENMKKCRKRWKLLNMVEK